jgi:hypothetical protein
MESNKERSSAQSSLLLSDNEIILLLKSLTIYCSQEISVLEIQHDLILKLQRSLLKEK